MTSELGESREKELDKAYTEALREAFKTLQNIDYKYVPKEDTKKTVVLVPSIEVVEQVEDPTANTLLQDEKEALIVAQTTDDFYYAQAIENGFQLVDSEPKIVMILWRTAAENVFLVKGESAIVFKEGEYWYYSQNNGKLGEKLRLNIKF
jgi:hypothetical protein